MHAAIFCLLISAVAVSADLNADVEDVISHLPMKQIESIGKQYVAADPSYGDGLHYVQQETYTKLVEEALTTKGGQDLIEYFNRHGIDAQSIILYIAKLTDEMIPKWLEPINEEDLDGPAITGNVMADYKNAVAASDFHEAVHKKMETSPEFANLVAAIKDPELKRILYGSSISKGLSVNGHGKGADFRKFWKKTWKVVKSAAIASAVLG